MTTIVLPTREDILAHGFPDGFLDEQRQQARVARAQEMGAFLGRLWHRLSGAPPKDTSWQRRLA